MPAISEANAREALETLEVIRVYVNKLYAENKRMCAMLIEIVDSHRENWDGLGWQCSHCDYPVSEHDARCVIGKAQKLLQEMDSHERE